MEDTVDFSIKKQGVSTPLKVHINKFMTFVEIYNLNGQPYTNYHKFDSVLGIMIEIYRQVFHYQYNYLFDIHHDNIKNSFK